jgi:multidrug efflux system membrane fusion protein
VRVETALVEDFTVQARAVGTVAPYNTVTVRSRVAGQLARVLVREGQKVTKGQLLAEIDPEPLRVALSQAQGEQQQNQAQLRNAESELARYDMLFKRDAVARQVLDRQAALVQQLRGTLKSDQAQVDNAQLQLSYTRIVAPIAGRVGLRRVDAGNLISANDANGLFTLTQTQPVSVVFNLPEPMVADVRAAHDGSKTPPQAEAWDRDNRARLAVGRLDTLDNQIDAATATLRLKARFENVDDALFPNQFVNVRLSLRQLPGAITIPTDAVQHGSRGSYVYVIVDSKARVRDIGLGPASGGRTVVTKGLAAGEPVVLEGLDRLEDGRAVNIVQQAAQVPAGSPLAPQDTPPAAPAR